MTWSEIFKLQTGTYRFAVYFLIGLIFLGIGGNVWVVNRAEEMEANRIILSVETDQIKQEIVQKEIQVRQEANEKALTSENDLVRQNAQWAALTSEFEQKTYDLFDNIFNYANGRQYTERREWAKDHVTPEVLDGGWFNTGLDVTGDSMVDALGYVSSLEHLDFYAVEDEGVDELTGYAFVTHQLARAGEFPGFAEYLFKFTYRGSDDKFTSLNLLGIKGTGDNTRD